MISYFLLSDEELLSLAKTDNYAYETLLIRYKGLVRKICRKYFLVGGEPEDLIQEGMIGLSTAISKFEPPYLFPSFAKLCITRKVQSAVKQSTRKKNEPLNKSTSLNTKNEEGEELLFLLPSPLPPLDEKLAREDDLCDLHKKIEQSLSEEEKHILDLYLQGFSYATIAEKLGIRTKKIDNTLTKIKNL